MSFTNEQILFLLNFFKQLLFPRMLCPLNPRFANFFKKLRRKVCGTLPPEFLVPHFNESVVRGSSGRVHLRNGTFLPPTRAFACLDMRSASEADGVHGESHVWKNRELKKGRKGINSLLFSSLYNKKPQGWKGFSLGFALSLT